MLVHHRLPPGWDASPSQVTPCMDGVLIHISLLPLDGMLVRHRLSPLDVMLVHYRKLPPGWDASPSQVTSPWME